MYPYSVVLLSSAKGFPGLDPLLASRAAKLAGTFPDLRTFRASKAAGTGPYLYLVHLRGEEDLQQLKLISDSCPGEPIVALIEGECDVNILFNVSRSGASQLVACPFTEADLSTALMRITRQFGRSAPVAKLVTVCGAVGGSGATTVAMNLAVELATRWEKTCILAEPTAPLGRLTSYLDVGSTHGTQELFFSKPNPDLNQLQQALTPVLDRLSLLAAPAPTFPYHPPSEDRVMQIVNDSRQVADIVIVDVPGPFTELDFKIVSQSDDVLLVSNASVPGLQALQMIREAVSHRRGSGPVRVVVNRVPAGMDVTHLRTVMKIEALWTLQDDTRGVATAVDKGGPIRAFAPESPVLADMNRLLTSMFGPPATNANIAYQLRRWTTRK